MQWIDANAERVEQLRKRGAQLPEGHGPALGVNFRSECGQWRVSVADLHAAEDARTWVVWDMTGVAPMLMMAGFKSSTVAFRAAEGIAESRVLRVALRLWAVGRAVAASARRFVR